MSIRNSIRNWVSLAKLALNSKDSFLAQKSFFDGEKNLVIFDVGAYVGDITAIYTKTFPSATVYCFEPFADSFQELSRLAKQESIRPYQVAFSDQNGKAMFQVNTDRSCNSIFPRPSAGAKYYSKSSQNIGQIEVETQILDTFCDTENITDIDILKLDVEGSELKVLSGASERLRDKRIKLIYTEIMFVPHYEGGCLFCNVSDFLSRYNYTLFNLYNLKRAHNRQLRWGNAIFLSPKMRARVESACQ
jgi:FkbM family methyltransferase